MNTELVKQRFGERVRELRQKVGLSQEALADAAQLDRSYVGCIERGERNLSLENICRLAKAVDVSPAAFFSWWAEL